MDIYTQAYWSGQGSSKPQETGNKARHIHALEVLAKTVEEEVKSRLQEKP